MICWSLTKLAYAITRIGFGIHRLVPNQDRPMARFVVDAVGVFVLAIIALFFLTGCEKQTEEPPIPVYMFVPSVSAQADKTVKPLETAQRSYQAIAPQVESKFVGDAFVLGEWATIGTSLVEARQSAETVASIAAKQDEAIANNLKRDEAQKKADEANKAEIKAIREENAELKKELAKVNTEVQRSIRWVKFIVVIGTPIVAGMLFAWGRVRLATSIGLVGGAVLLCLWAFQIIDLYKWWFVLGGVGACLGYTAIETIYRKTKEKLSWWDALVRSVLTPPTQDWGKK